MSKNFFRAKNGLNVAPTDASSVVNPEVGDIIVDSSDNNKLKRYDDVTASWKDVGSGVGGINYISTNSDFEGGTTGWNAYADTPELPPVDGTGGTPPAGFLTTTTSSPLRGTKSLLLTWNGGSSGYGASYDFTIDAADKAQVLRISFDYETSALYSDDEAYVVTVYVYDVTNSRLIEVVDRDIKATSFGKYVGTFQTSPDSVSYRLIFHSLNYAIGTIKIDNVIVGPQTIVKGAIVTDWQAYTPVISGFGTPTGISFYWRRVGANLEAYGTFTSGTSTATAATFTLPNGLVSSVTTLPTQIAGRWHRGTSSATTVKAGTIAIGNGDNVVSMGIDDYTTASSPFTAANGSSIVSSGGTIRFSLSIPIQGWSSNVVLSEDAGNRQIVADITQNITQSIADNTDTKVAFTSAASIVSDSANAWDSSLFRYNVPESGYYTILGVSTYTSTGAVERNIATSIYVNGSSIRISRTRCLNSNSGTCEVNHPCYYLSKGDYVELYTYQNDVAAATALNCIAGRLMIAKLSSPQTIAASENVHLSLQHTSGQVIPNATLTTLVYNVIVEDTHNAYNSTTGIWICPQSGYYQVSANLMLTNVTGWTEGESLTLSFLSNNTTWFRGYIEINANPATSVYVRPTTISGVIYISKGQNAYLQMTQSNDASVAMYAGSGNFNFFTITKVG